MEQIIWIEMLAPNRQVLARHRCAQGTVRIGRAYDNDIVLDDPYVAPHHLLIQCDADGILTAQDLGSINGVYADNTRTSRHTLTDTTILRVGQTSIRVCAPNRQVASEQKLPEINRAWIKTALQYALLFLILNLYFWGSTTTAYKLSDFIKGNLVLAGGVFAWSGFWAVLSRIFSGTLHFGHHFKLAVWFFSGSILAYLFVQLVAYAFAVPFIMRVYEPFSYVLFGIFAYYALRLVGSSRNGWKLGIVATLTTLAVIIPLITKHLEPPITTRYDYVDTLAPPSFRLVPYQPLEQFLLEAGKLQGKLDQARQEDDEKKAK
jgi:hypothetical protein